MNTTRRRRTTLSGVLVAVLSCLLLVGTANATTRLSPSDLIESIDLVPDGASTLVFRVPAGAGELTADRIVLTEEGEAIEGVVVQRAATAEVDAPLRVTTTQIVAIDTSGSTRGEALEAAKAAAQQFVAEATSRGTAVGLITFGDTAVEHHAPGSDPAPLLATIAALEAGGDTALRDAVVLAARLTVEVPGEHRLVLFTDGRDEGSAASPEAAAAAAAAADLRIDAIGLTTSASDPVALRTLVLPTGGQLLEVRESAGLAAAFATVAQDLPTTWLASWTSTRTGPDLSVTLAVETSSGTLTDATVVVNPRYGEVGEPRAVTLPQVGVFGAAGSLPLVLGLVALALAVVFAGVLVPRDDPRTKGVLDLVDGITPKDATKEERDGLRAAVLATQARIIAENVPRPKGYDERTAQRIEQAGWRIRPAELLVFRVGGAVLAGVLLFGLTRSAPVAVIGVALGAAVPGILLNRARTKRHDDFVEQLPDILQLMSGSLKAGYGLLQSLDTVVQEAAPPVSTEFRRVVAEHRLGLPLEEALMDLSGRIASDDLRWAVVAMNIQRRVGGNLADLLETVADTLRERARVQRHVQSLSAEGRLSAKVLIGLPFFIAGYVSIINPEYISELFTDPRGQMMTVGAIILMIVGTMWMRRIVDIEI